MKTWLAMKAIISMDHRINDGTEAAQLMQALRQEHTCTAPDAQSPRSVAEWECVTRRDDVAKYLEEPLRLLCNQLLIQTS